MTRRSRTSGDAESRLDALESDREHAGEIFVASIGGDPDTPTGWLSPRAYERHYGERPESAFSFNINMTGEDS